MRDEVLLQPSYYKTFHIKKGFYVYHNTFIADQVGRIELQSSKHPLMLPIFEKGFLLYTLVPTEQIQVKAA